MWKFVGAVVLIYVVGAGAGALQGLLTFLLLFVVWVAGHFIKPLRACPNCGGSPRRFGVIQSRSFSFCAVCRRRGYVQRPGTVILRDLGLMSRAPEMQGRGWRRARRRDPN